MRRSSCLQGSTYPRPPSCPGANQVPFIPKGLLADILLVYIFFLFFLQKSCFDAQGQADEERRLSHMEARDLFWVSYMFLSEF